MAISLLKAMGTKYLSRYKSHSCEWEASMVGFNGIELRFVLTELKLSVERELTGTGEDELGTFTIKGTVNRAGFAEFIKEYTTGKLKPVTQFFGNFINACIIGNWVIKEQGTGR